MNRCTDMTLHGRCPQHFFPAKPGDEPVERCYYHQKIFTGLTGTAETIGLIEDDEG